MESDETSKGYDPLPFENDAAQKISHKAMPMEPKTGTKPCLAMTAVDTLRPLTTGSYLAVQFSSLEALPTVIHICLQSALNVSHQYMHE